MTRSILSAMDTAIQSNSLVPVYFCDFVFDEGELNLWAGGVGTIVWNGKTYTGGGTLLDVESAPETTSLESRGAAFVLTGQTDEVRSIALNTDPRNKPCRIYFGAMNLSAGTIIADPVLIFEGVMDVFTIDDNPNNATISLDAERRMLFLRKNKVRRFTPEDQTLEDSSDTSMRFVAALQDKKIVWG